MILIYHLNAKISEIINLDSNELVLNHSGYITDIMPVLALLFPNKKIIWCHVNLKSQLDLNAIDSLFCHNKMMLSFASTTSYLGTTIGYVDDSLFVNCIKTDSYPTWQMSSSVGVIHASVLNAFKGTITAGTDFDYFLNSIAKLGMPAGLLCYSEPRLLKNSFQIESFQASKFTVFKFVKQHYKTRWVFLLFLNLMLYERQFAVFPFLISLFYSNRNQISVNLDTIEVQSKKKVIEEKTIDVIIPTIGRKNYLYDVLKDFSAQTLLPKTIVIVEQNPDQNSSSELDYIYKESWPFEIKHFFIHQAGACNARNLALNQVESEWVFLADDDNRFATDLLSTIFSQISKYGSKVVTTSYIQKKERKSFLKVIQWSTFGAGNSFVKSELLKKVRFNMGLEFGYGEDFDFGMQLRKLGEDVLYLPTPEIIHLKAPIGGFRTKPVLPWHAELVQPKPSPTVLLSILTHNTKEQLLGYKTTLFIKYYKFQNIKNPFRYYRFFKTQWGRSVFWANELKSKS